MMPQHAITSQPAHLVSQNRSLPSSPPVTNRCSLLGAQLTSLIGSLCALLTPPVRLMVDKSHNCTLLPPAARTSDGWLGCRDAVQN
jgi:hypothetical protein